MVVQVPTLVSLIPTELLRNVQLRRKLLLSADSLGQLRYKLAELTIRVITTLSQLHDNVEQSRLALLFTRSTYWVSSGCPGSERVLAHRSQHLYPSPGAFGTISSASQSYRRKG